MKLPVLATVREAFAFLWTNRRFFLISFSPLAAVFLLLWLVGRLELPWSLILAGPLYVIGGIYTLVGAFVAWHRAYLVSADPLTLKTVLTWKRRHFRFILAYIYAGFCMIPVEIVGAVIVTAFSALTDGWSGRGGFAPSGFLLGPAGIIWTLTWIAAAWVFARISMLFPSTAIDEPLTVGQAWRATDGNGWRLFWIIAIVGIPTWAILAALEWEVLSPRTHTEWAGNFAIGLFGMLFWIFSAIVGLGVGITALSISYRRLTEGVTRGMPDAA
jgi:hypothetical protein